MDSTCINDPMMSTLLASNFLHLDPSPNSTTNTSPATLPSLPSGSSSQLSSQMASQHSTYGYANQYTNLTTYASQSSGPYSTGSHSYVNSNSQSSAPGSGSGSYYGQFSSYGHPAAATHHHHHHQSYPSMNYGYAANPSPFYSPSQSSRDG